MTLSTDIYITGTGVTMREVYEKVNDILGIPDTRLFTETSTHIGNHLGQGFPVIVDVYAAADGSRVTPEHETGTYGCDEDCTRHSCTESYHVHVDLDTAYSYQHPVTGDGCAFLHAVVIFALIPWLEERGCTLRWANEFTGEVHDSDDIEAFSRFVGGGVDAAKWFREKVIPIIESEGGTVL